MRAYGVLALLAVSQSASAQTADRALTDEAARLAAQTAVINARTAEVSARTAYADAQRKALNLPSFAGTTAIDAKGAEIESWMLSAGTINAAAAHIVGRLPTAAAGRIVVLGRDDPFDLMLPDAIEAEIGAHERSLKQATLRAGCGAPRLSPGDGGSTLSTIPAAPIIGAALGVLRTDTEIAGVNVDAEDRTLVNAIAAQAGHIWIVPSEAVAPLQDSPLRTRFDDLFAQRDAVAACRAEIAAIGGSADKIAVLDGALDRVDAFQEQVSAPNDKGHSLLGRAITLASIGSDTPRVLRVGIEKAGGSRLKRANLWTTLGAPAIGVTGGLVASYRLVHPGTGVVEAAGVITCRTALTSMRAVQAGRVRQSACGASATGVRP